MKGLVSGFYGAHKPHQNLVALIGLRRLAGIYLEAWGEEFYFQVHSGCWQKPFSCWLLERVEWGVWWGRGPLIASRSRYPCIFKLTRMHWVLLRLSICLLPPAAWGAGLYLVGNEGVEPCHISVCSVDFQLPVTRSLCLRIFLEPQKATALPVCENQDVLWT